MKLRAFLILTALVLVPLSAATAPTFTVVNSGSHGSELNLAVMSNGHIFVGGWDTIARSTDDGATWTHSSTNPVVTVAADRILVPDKETGRVFVDDTTLGCTVLSWSDDEGATWLTNPLACGAGATDHEKLAVGHPTTIPGTPVYPNLVYSCANGLSHTNCAVSNDGGVTFTTIAPHGVGCAFDGAPMADASGILYDPTAQCGLKVRRTTNSGTGTWTEVQVATDTSADAPDVGITSDGTVYVFHSNANWQPEFYRSTDHGLHWKGPFAVPVTGLTSSVFPVIVGGAPGKIALSFYGTTDTAAGWDHNPGNAPSNIRWDGYIAIVTDADSTAPTVAPTKVTADPLQIGCLSKLGSCLNNINDYEDVDVGPDGRVYAVFTDGCLGCTSAATSTDDAAVVAVQTSGATLN